MRSHPGVKIRQNGRGAFSLAARSPELLAEDSSESELSGNRCSTICLEGRVPQEWLSFRPFGKEQHV